MNYRHAFHAGNFAEVFKHAALVALLRHLLGKPKPFLVLDTHAGAGWYDLAGEEAAKTGEWEAGIGRVIGAGAPGLQPYLDLVRAANPDGLRRYPGSPAIVAALLREGDRLVACELRPDDAALLRRAFAADRRVAVHHRDGYEALKAFLPPPERRGLVFIDPPFEDRQEFERLAKALQAAWRRWPTGIFAAWYPVKDRRGPDLLGETFGAPDGPPALAAELFRRPLDGANLAGTGLLVLNPPFRFAETLCAVGQDLLAAFAWERGSFSCRSLAGEGVR